MIDLHSHILPGFDDGAQDMAETMAMCRVAETDGISVVAATPHWREGDWIPDPEDIRAAVGRVNDRLNAKGMALRLVPGMEVRLDPALVEGLSEGRVLSLNGGKYLLMEFHPVHVPAGVDNLLQRLRAAGYRVILGHPERNQTIQQNPAVVQSFVEGMDPWDVLVQITADSLTGQAGKVAAKTARRLLKSNLVHAIASDAHSPFLRAPRLSEALVVAAGVIGRKRAQRLVHDIPRAVLDGGDFPPFEKPRTVKRRWIGA